MPGRRADPEPSNKVLSRVFREPVAGGESEVVGESEQGAMTGEAWTGFVFEFGAIVVVLLAWCAIGERGQR